MSVNKTAAAPFWERETVTRVNSLKASTNGIGLAVILLLMPTLVNANTLCVNPSDADNCYATIQHAVDAAVSGDLILISPHPDPKGYNENVTISTSGLTLRGNTIAPSANLTDQACPAVVIDGCETLAGPTTCNAVSFAVDAADTVIERILLRNGRINFLANSTNSVFRESCIVGNTSHTGVYSPSLDADIELGILNTLVPVDGLIVEHSVFQGGMGQSIDFYGNSIVIRNNQLYAVDDGIHVVGDDMHIASNTMRLCNDFCLNLSGDRMAVEGNLLVGGDAGISATGDQVSIVGNVVERFSGRRNIQVSCGSLSTCTGGVVSGNRVSFNLDDQALIQIQNAAHFIVEDNWLAFGAGHGLNFGGRDSQIRGNEIYRSGSEGAQNACLYMSVSGSGYGNNIIENNQLSLCPMNGIYQAGGTNNEYRNNIIVGAGQAGIRVNIGDDTVIENNQISDTHGEGIANLFRVFDVSSEGAINTHIINNTLINNRVDICSDTALAAFSGNTFSSGGEDTSCLINSH